MARFIEPEWSAPLDVAAQIAATPGTGLVKGMFFQSVLDEAKLASGRAPGRGRYVAFKDYPLREWVEVLAECAALAHPRLPIREGLRRLGGKAYPTFAESMVGRVLMSVAGDFTSALRIVPRIYAVSGNVATAEVEATEGHAIVRLRGVWDFADAWQVGVFEGGLRAFRTRGTVRIAVLSTCDADVEIDWDPVR